MSSTALERVDPIAALTEAPWYDQVNDRQLALITSTVAKGLDKAEVGQFLELARSLGMNPWAGEIWAAKSKGKDGGPGKLLMMVGRDGLIGHAERNFDDYNGYDSGVVYANDTFERVEPNPDSKSMRGRAGVVHTQAHPKDRGEVLGAWAVCERRNRPPRFFYAALSEYMPRSDGQVKYSPWGSAVAVMIEKVPISIVHRTLCGLGSVYLEEEVARARFGEDEPDPMASTEALMTAIDENIPAEHADRALDLLKEINSLAPNSWSAGKVEMIFRGKTPYAVSVELSNLEKQIEELRARPAEETVTDAEVVDEPAAVERTPDEQEAHEKRVQQLTEALEDPDLKDEDREQLEEELESISGPDVSPEQDTLL